MRNWPLQSGETVLWQGRPAPRCYVFRQFPTVVAATIMMLTAGAFLGLVDISVLSGWWWMWMAALLSGAACGPLRLLYRRRCWEFLYYAVTNRRILMQKGKHGCIVARSLTNLKSCRTHYYSKQLAQIRLIFFTESPLTLECLDMPETCLAVLERECAQRVDDDQQCVR